jgi:hypothetical protein
MGLAFSRSDVAGAESQEKSRPHSARWYVCIAVFLHIAEQNSTPQQDTLIGVVSGAS